MDYSILKNFFFLNILAVLIFCDTSSISAQCFPDRHNTNLDAGWLSCQSSSSPNPNRPNSQWILYELEERQTVNSIKVWNINHPDHLTSGTRTIEIDYQNPDGTWSSHSGHFIHMAEGSGFYEGQELDLPSEFVTDKILFTLVRNHGGSCFGLAETRFGLINQTTSTVDISEEHFEVIISPNPFEEFASVTIHQLEEQKIKYQLVNNLGQIILSNFTNTVNGSARFVIPGGDVPAGSYYLKIIDGNRISSRKISHQIK